MVLSQNAKKATQAACPTGFSFQEGGGAGSPVFGTASSCPDVTVTWVNAAACGSILRDQTPVLPGLSAAITSASAASTLPSSPSVSKTFLRDSKKKLQMPVPAPIPSHLTLTTRVTELSSKRHAATNSLPVTVTHGVFGKQTRDGRKIQESAVTPKELTSLAASSVPGDTGFNVLARCKSRETEAPEKG